MKKAFIILIVCTIQFYAQPNNSNIPVGQFVTQEYQNGKIISKIVTTPQVCDPNYRQDAVQPIPVNNSINGSNVRWSYGDPVSIGNYCSESGNGLKTVVGWYLNNMRTQAFGNTDNTPLWTHMLPNALYYNYVAASYDGSKIADGYNLGIYLLNGVTGDSIYTFNVTSLISNSLAGPVAITRNGDVVIGSVNVQTSTDTSYVVAFSGNTPNMLWRFKSPPTTGGSGIVGIKISGNDSLAIINGYLTFWVIKTYTGQVIYTGSVNPSSNNGTQMPQGISGNGNIIATINYNGYVRVYQWSGSTYNLLWQHQETPGSFYNWMSAVDVSYDGSMVAIGTLNFVTSSSYDGKVKLFSVTGGSTPIWKYSGMGDEVNSVRFSRNGRILTACSWGSLPNPSVNNLLIFKTTHTDSIPIFAVNSTGSFFCTDISDDGTTVIGSGKAVHARNFGSGGILYNLFIDTAEFVGISNNNNRVPDKYELGQNFPNPFNPSTQITYALPKEGYVSLKVYDITGREIQQLVNSFQRAGRYSVNFKADDLSSGLYFYRLESSGFTETKKMTLLK